MAGCTHAEREEGETNVREDEVVGQEVQQLKEQLDARPALLRHVAVRVVPLCNLLSQGHTMHGVHLNEPAEQDGHNARQPKGLSQQERAVREQHKHSCLQHRVQLRAAELHVHKK